MIIAEARFRFGDVVWVPFPFVEAPRMRERPALVISAQLPDEEIELLWVLMVTSAANKGWQGDISLEQRFGECGLEVPCIIRVAKIATVEAQRARKCGELPADIGAAVREALTSLLD